MEHIIKANKYVKAKVAEQIFEFEFSDEKALEGTVNGEAFKMDLAQQGDVHHVLHKHGSYKVKMVRFDKRIKHVLFRLITMNML